MDSESEEVEWNLEANVGEHECLVVEPRKIELEAYIEMEAIVFFCRF